MADVCGRLAARLRLPKLSADLPGLRYVGDGAPQREKKIDITENGTYEVPADPGTSLTKVTAVVSVNQLEFANWVNYLYYKATFPPGSKIKLILPNVQRCDATFAETRGIAEITMEMYHKKDRILVGRTFQMCKDVEIINWLTDRPIYEPGYMFYGCEKLRIINGVLDFSASDSVSDYVLHACPELKEVRIAPGTIKTGIVLSSSRKLSPESVQSIIDGLADLSAGTPQTITFSSKVTITEAQKAQVTAKNWNLVQR